MFDETTGQTSGTDPQPDPGAGASASSGSSATATATAPTWPAKGYDGPAPWDLASEHAPDDVKVAVDPLTGEVNRRPARYTGPGAVTHDEPQLTSGIADASCGGAVSRLVSLLADLGYATNAVINGASPAGVLDTSVMADVAAFRNDYAVNNDPAEFAGREVPAARLVDEHIGPYIWQAIYETVADKHGDGVSLASKRALLEHSGLLL